MIRLTEFAVRQKSVIILLAIAVMIAGWLSWTQARQELLPDIQLPFVTVITPVPGAGAEDVAEQVTIPVERALANVPRLQTVQSSSGNSLSLVFAEFEFGTDAQGNLVLIDEVLTADSSRFWPADSYRVGISPPSYDKQYVRDYLETLDWDKTPPAPKLPPEVIAKTSEKYREALARLTGRKLA